MAQGIPYEGYETWKGWAASAFGTFSGEDEAYFEAEIFGRLGRSGGARIVEIGFGNGHLLACAARRGHQVTGVEANGVLGKRATDAGYEVRHSVADLPSDTFDAAVALDVIEHIPNHEMAGFLGEIRRSLKPGGLVILRFPNGDSPFGRAYQHGDVTHVNVVGTIKIRYFANAAGLEVVDVANPSTPRGRLAWRRKLAYRLRDALRDAVEFVIGWIFFGGKRPLAQNLVAVLKRP